MQVKSIAEWEHSAILSTFIMLPFVCKTFVLSIFEWLLKTGFTVFLKEIFKKVDFQKVEVQDFGNFELSPMDTYLEEVWYKVRV